jgi:hypothetical protein
MKIVKELLEQLGKIISHRLVFKNWSIEKKKKSNS